MSTALFIDTFSREVNVSAVSVTNVPNRGLVLRFGAEVGKLSRLTKNGELKNEELPILVATRGYHARSSAGYVEVVTDWRGDWNPIRNVVGIQGMPWREKKGLALLAKPIQVRVLRPGTNIIPVAVHSNSNPATAQAALAGMKLRSKVEPEAVFVAEGQSDQALVWRLVGYHEIYKTKFEPTFPEEHRLDRFSDEAILEKVVYRLGKDDRERVYALALITAAIAAQKQETVEFFRQSQEWAAKQSIYRLLNERVDFHWLTAAWEIFSLAKGMLEAKFAEGYKLVLQKADYPNEIDTPIEVVGPDGDFSTFYFPVGRERGHSQEMPRERVEEALFSLLANTEEEKEEFRRRRSPQAA